ncbi:MAG: Ureidoglycolate hydrolase [Oscillospiraceae bacterium]|nr:Ureidoglycolate hydrolase [Oscillospiraceae bacterium]
MRQIHIEPITNEAFAPFGQFYNMENPQGYALCGELHQFFPDRVNADSNHRIGYSPILVKKPAKMVITQQEYHTTTWEMILPMNDDMILHVAPASAGTPVTQYAKAFLVPKHTLVKMNAAIWHLAPLPANADQLAAMIILPECTYANDCTVVDLPEDQQFEIVK